MNTIISNINLSEVELKHVLSEVKCLSNFDFSLYSHSFIKRRTEYFMSKNNIFSEGDLIYRINNSSALLGHFIENVFFQQFELFRDVELWNYIEEKVLPKFLKQTEVKIYFPYSSGAEQLYSFLYILNNFNTEKFKIYITGVTDRHVSKIKNPNFTKAHVKASEKNISLLKTALDKDDVFFENNGEFKVNVNYSGNLIFTTCDFFKEQHFADFDLVFFQNKMIFFNTELKAKSLNYVVRSLKKGAYLILGERETIDKTIEKKIKHLHKGMSIYKRKTFLLT